MSMLRKIKSLFIVEDGSKKPQIPVKKKEDDLKEKTGSSSYSTRENFDDIPSIYSGSSEGEIDEKMVNILMNAIEKNNLDGFDYLEYKQALQSLAEMGMDESTKFKSAYAMANTMGATKDSLIKAIEHYLKVLDIEKEKFDEALKNQKSRQIQDREQQIERLRIAIQNKEKEIERMQLEIQNEKQKLEGIEAQITESAERVEMTKVRFFSAFHIIHDQIVDDKKKINDYL